MRSIGKCEDCGKEQFVDDREMKPLLSTYGLHDTYSSGGDLYTCEKCGKKICHHCRTWAGGTGFWNEVVGYRKIIWVCFDCYKALHEEVRRRWNYENGPETEYNKNPY